MRGRMNGKPNKIGSRCNGEECSDCEEKKMGRRGIGRMLYRLSINSSHHPF
jgi:hypothetical protein